MITLSRKNIYYTYSFCKHQKPKYLKNLGTMGLNRDDLVGLIWQISLLVSLVFDLNFLVSLIFLQSEIIALYYDCFIENKNISSM